ncbi:MAG: iron ABC transporter permease [Rikenellaceae bacterium]
MNNPKKTFTTLFTISLLICLVLVAMNLLFGSISVPFEVFKDLVFNPENVENKWKVIVVSSRLTQTITALFAGAALAVSGLMLQTLFCNPLAAPSILGISSGSGVGVAIVMLFLGTSATQIGFSGHLAVVAGAILGAMAVLAIIIMFSTVIKSNVMLLVVGLMVGYITSSAVSLLSYYATQEGLVSFVAWGLGNFSGVSTDSLPYFLGFVIFGLFIAIMMIKPLNALLLGDKYSENLGLNIKTIRILVLISTGILTAVVTAFCGPIAFIGLAVPHIARLLLKSTNHLYLLPLTIVLGANIALVCNLLTVLAIKGSVIPLNVITPLMGAPVIIYIIVNKKKIAYFN